MAAQPAPKMLNTFSAQKGKSFASAVVGAVTDLRAISGFPNFAPQRTEFHCTVAAGSVTVTLEDGTDFIIEIALGETRKIDLPIRAFKSLTAATVTANCYWWANPGPGDWAYSPVINP